MKPIYKWLLLLCALMVPYLAFAYLFVAGRQVIPMWTRIVLGGSLPVIFIVLVIGAKAIFPKNQQATKELPRGAGLVRFLFLYYAIGIPLVLLELLAQKKWAYIPSLIVPVLLALYLWKWLSSVKSVLGSDNG